MFIFKNLIISVWNYIFSYVYKVTLTQFWISYLLYTISLYGIIWILFLFLIYYVYLTCATNSLTAWFAFANVPFTNIISTDQVYALYGPVMVYGIFPRNSLIFQVMASIRFVLDTPADIFEACVRAQIWPFYIWAQYRNLRDFEIINAIVALVDIYEFTTFLHIFPNFETSLLNNLFCSFLYFVHIFHYLYVIIIFFFIFLHSCFSANHVLKDYLRNIHKCLYIYYFSLLVYIFFRLALSFLTTYVFLNSFSYAFLIISCFLFINIISLNISKFINILSYLLGAFVSVYFFIYLYYFVRCLGLFYFGFAWLTNFRYFFDIMSFTISFDILLQYINIINSLIIHYIVDNAYVLLTTQLEWLILEAFINSYINLYN